VTAERSGTHDDENGRKEAQKAQKQGNGLSQSCVSCAFLRLLLFLFLNR